MLSALPAETGAPGVAPHPAGSLAGGTSSQPSTGASLSSSPSVPVAVQRGFCSSSRMAWPNPASSCRATTLPRHRRRLSARRRLSLGQLRLPEKRSKVLPSPRQRKSTCQILQRAHPQGRGVPKASMANQKLVKAACEAAGAPPRAPLWPCPVSGVSHKDCSYYSECIIHGN